MIIGIGLTMSPLWLLPLAVAQERSGTGGVPPTQLAQMWGGPMGGGCGPMMDGMMMMGGLMTPGADSAQLPDIQSTGAKLLNQYCTQCHGLPTPELHSAAGWPPVTQRMATRMQSMANNSGMSIRVPTSKELQTITEYLQKHAAK
ncbi:hypothetical protein OL229_07495 [Neisseriaceae bacterium JH1-16]|nr:hypothetical protein [Neisseriaceae bacterium JH1-16]